MSDFTQIPGGQLVSFFLLGPLLLGVRSLHSQNRCPALCQPCGVCHAVSRLHEDVLRWHGRTLEGICPIYALWMYAFVRNRSEYVL